MITYPKAKVTVNVQRRKPKGSTRRGQMHTTETASSAFYTRYPYYTFQVREYGGIVYWRQFCDPEQISHALRHNKGDPETNGEGIVNPSLAIIGYARNMKNMSDLLVREIAEFMIWAEDKLGIEAAFNGHAAGGSSCYGENSPCRMTWRSWRGVTGWVGHQNVPGNTHWDPHLPTDRIEAAIAQIKNGETPPSDPGLKDGQISMDTKLYTLSLYSGYSSKGKQHHREDVKTCQALLLKEGHADENTTNPRNYADGYFGPGTEKAVKSFQVAEGLAVDGVVGAATWAALLNQEDA